MSSQPHAIPSAKNRRRMQSTLRWIVVFGAIVLTVPASAHAYFANGIYHEVMCDLFDLLSGSMGAFFFSSALLVGVAAAVFGNLSQAKAAIVVAVGCVTANSVVSMHSAFSYTNCGVTVPGRAAPTESALTTTERQIISDSKSPVAFNPDFASPESNDE